MAIDRKSVVQCCVSLQIQNVFCVANFPRHSPVAVRTEALLINVQLSLRSKSHIDANFRGYISQLKNLAIFMIEFS